MMCSAVEDLAASNRQQHAELSAQHPLHPRLSKTQVRPASPPSLSAVTSTVDCGRITTSSFQAYFCVMCN